MKTYTTEALVILTLLGIVLALCIHGATQSRVPRFHNALVELRN